MKLIHCVVLFATLAGFACAQEVDFSLGRIIEMTEPHRTIDEVGERFLDDPEILARLGLTRIQLRTAYVGDFFEIMEIALGSASDEEKGRKMFDRMLGSTGILKAKSLTEAQRRELRKVSLQKAPLDSLLTNEIVLALSLSLDQRRVLGQVFRDRTWGIARKVDELPENVAFTELMGRLSELQAAGATNIEIAKVFAEGMSKIAAGLTVGLEAARADLEEDANGRAMAVLTEDQRKHYKEMVSAAN